MAVADVEVNVAPRESYMVRTLLEVESWTEFAGTELPLAVEMCPDINCCCEVDGTELQSLFMFSPEICWCWPSVC